MRSTEIDYRVSSSVMGGALLADKIAAQSMMLIILMMHRPWPAEHFVTFVSLYSMKLCALSAWGRNFFDVSMYCDCEL